MANDDMKKMLMLIESCSCESNKEDTDEVTEGGTPLSSLTHRYVDDPNHPDFKSGSNTEPEKPKTLQDIIKNNDFNGLQVWAMDNKNSPLVKGASAAADAAENSIKQELGLAGKLPYEIPASIMMDKINPARTKAMFDYLRAHATESENNAMEEDFNLDAFIESLYEMSGEQIDEISAKKAFGAAGARGLQAVGKLAKAPIGAGLSFGASVAAGLSPDRKQGEEWIDRSDMARDKTIGLVTTAGKRAGQAVTNLGRGVTKALGEGEEAVSTTKMSTAQEMAEKLFAKNPKMTSDDVLDKGYELVLAQHGRGRADRLFHFNADFAEELVDMYNQIKDEAVSTTKMSTSEEMAAKLFAENPKMTSDDVLDKGYELVLAQNGKGRADRLFHFNADFASELVTAYNRLKASKSTVESDDAEFQSFMETLNYVMRKK